MVHTRLSSSVVPLAKRSSRLSESPTGGSQNTRNHCSVRTQMPRYQTFAGRTLTLTSCTVGVRGACPACRRCCDVSSKFGPDKDLVIRHTHVQNIALLRQLGQLANSDSTGGSNSLFSTLPLVPCTSVATVRAQIEVCLNEFSTDDRLMFSRKRKLRSQPVMMFGVACVRLQSSCDCAEI